MEKKIKSTLGIISQELFNISLITYLVLLLIETLNKGFVTDFFNLNLLLAIVLISGLILFSPLAVKKDPNMWEVIDLTFEGFFAKLAKKSGIAENDFYFITIISLSGAFLVFLKTADLNNLLQSVLSASTALIIFTLSFLIYKED